ncbi:MAG: hypothetical protein QGD96_03075 [Anaerolineae bacterium]|nr:hypothetical protein [Anaerolineae bacterium]
MLIKSKIVRIVFWILVGVILTTSSLALRDSERVGQEATGTQTAVTPPATTPTPGVRHELGSTDEIVLITSVIVLIIAVPILLRRQVWLNGKRKK